MVCCSYKKSNIYRFIYVQYATGLVKEGTRLLHLLAFIFMGAYISNRYDISNPFLCAADFFKDTPEERCQISSNQKAVGNQLAINYQSSIYQAASKQFCIFASKQQTTRTNTFSVWTCSISIQLLQLKILLLTTYYFIFVSLEKLLVSS